MSINTNQVDKAILNRLSDEEAQILAEECESVEEFVYHVEHSDFWKVKNPIDAPMFTFNDDLQYVFRLAGPTRDYAMWHPYKMVGIDTSMDGKTKLELTTAYFDDLPVSIGESE